MGDAHQRGDRHEHEKNGKACGLSVLMAADAAPSCSSAHGIVATVTLHERAFSHEICALY